jgi:mannose-1-phosphate guanylyltransferase/mannose-1-phosphate guanylyltransferase/mannose-6-phosphate isomerase
LIVVDTADALMVVKKEQSQNVKHVVDELKKQKSILVTEHRFEYRPWGYFEILKDTPQFKSKIIRVNPHSQLSYQSHAKREEHWTITQGTGEVVLNDQVIPVKAGTHIHIPLGAKHRMRNNSSEMLEFVEVQLGTYFGEDDIVRYQDDYKRT